MSSATSAIWASMYWWGPMGLAVHREAGDMGLVLVEAGPQLPGQVQAGVGGVAELQFLHPAHALDVVVEPAVARHQLVQRLLARVPERAVPDVVASAMASVRSWLAPSARASVRPTAVISKVWVRRVR
jgi:hypothetical protein